jgi:hypothetical protein
LPNLPPRKSAPALETVAMAHGSSPGNIDMENFSELKAATICEKASKSLWMLLKRGRRIIIIKETIESIKNNIW